MVQWLRLLIPNAGGLALSSGWGTRSHILQLKILCVATKPWWNQINKNKFWKIRKKTHRSSDVYPQKRKKEKERKRQKGKNKGKKKEYLQVGISIVSVILPLCNCFRFSLAFDKAREKITTLSWWLSGKESACQCRDAGLIPGLKRSPGGGHGNPL